MNIFYRGYVIHEDIRAICYTIYGRVGGPGPGGGRKRRLEPPGAACTVVDGADELTGPPPTADDDAESLP